MFVWRLPAVLQWVRNFGCGLASRSPRCGQDLGKLVVVSIITWKEAIVMRDVKAKCAIALRRLT